MFVGVGASRVRDLFKQAKEKSPAIIFIDEIDAIGRAKERIMALIQMMKEKIPKSIAYEMDGFGTNWSHYFGSCNRADVLDGALMRRVDLTDKFMLICPT